MSLSRIVQSFSFICIVLGSLLFVLVLSWIVFLGGGLFSSSSSSYFCIVLDGRVFVLELGVMIFVLDLFCPVLGGRVFRHCILIFVLVLFCHNIRLFLG